MDRQRREEELKHRSSKKSIEAEQSMLNRVWFLSVNNMTIVSHVYKGLMA